jgi:short-subunit dehydrogenase
MRDGMTVGPSDGCAWVTGASSGIGRAVALRLARAGWTVVASARDPESLHRVAAERAVGAGRILAEPLDITDAAAVEATVARIESRVGPIALALLNAGTHAPVAAHAFHVQTFRDLTAVNLLGTVACLASILPRVLARRRGQIAIVASLAGYRGLPTAAAYGMTKAGLINMAEALKPELDAANVKLQIVNPGFVRTPLTDRNRFAMPFLMGPEAAAEAVCRGLGRRAFEIAFPCRFVLMMWLLRLMPYPLFFAVARRLLPRQ